MELESLGVMQELGPHESATHVERWKLFRNMILPESDEERAEALGRLLDAGR
jgi:hypothetical protein